MTSLQGQMGAFYALRSGEPQAVALAIFEHYLPRFAGDASPSARPGLVIGLADRLDTLVGLFAANLAPSGNKDPFAQRRAALGLVQNLVGGNVDLDLAPAIDAAAGGLPIAAGSDQRQAVLTFIVERLRNVLLEQGRRYDAVEAVLAVQGANPARAAQAVQALEDAIAAPVWSSLLPAYARCVRITRDLKERFTMAPADYTGEGEAKLYAAVLQAQAAPRRPGSVENFIAAFAPLIPAINHFFETTMVMAEDPAVRRNRLALVQSVAALAQDVADFSALEGF
jgi:glycyl-tRNA synthetase